MLNILEMTLPELTQWVTGDLGLPKFRAQQIWQWVWQRMARSFDEMTNISKPVREELSKKAQIVWPEVDKIQTSSDSTTKFLLRLGDGERVETVLIPSTSREGNVRWTQCLSTQVGCPMHCTFCSTGTMGFTRNMTMGEILGQILSALMVFFYMFHFKTIRLRRRCFRIRGNYFANIMRFGTSACFNQIAMTVVQIVMNNVLSHYGASSVYGSNIPLACAGIITKVNMIFMSFVIGISQGIQPVIGFNYGAKKYNRVKKTYLLALATATFLSLIAFACFQLFPRQIIRVFGEGSELYYQFSERYFRIYMFFTLINGIQPVTANFFNSIGKSQLGIFMSLTRQILFLLPLIVIFPIFMGIDGVMYAGPIADVAAAVVCGVFTVKELRELSRLNSQHQNV